MTETPSPSPYENVNDSGFTESWEAHISNPQFSRDFMPSVPAKLSHISAILRIKSKSTVPLVFHWEAWVYDVDRNSTYPIILDLVPKQANEIRLKAGKSVEQKFQSQDGPPLSPATKMFLVIKLTDSTGKTVSIRSITKSLWGPF